MRASATFVDTKSGRQAFLAGDGELENAKAAALVIHGGKEQSLAPAAENQAAVMRMAPIAALLTRAGGPHGLAVWRLRFRYRGWNGDEAPAVEDLRWAVQQMRIRHGDAPVVLVGHSMGGRAAFRAGDAAHVVGVLGLAPWLPPDEPCEHLSGRQLLIVHGTRDRITSAADSLRFVERARPQASEAGYIALRSAGHAMVWRAPAWHRIAKEFVLYSGLRNPPSPTIAEALRRGEIER